MISTDPDQPEDQHFEVVRAPSARGLREYALVLTARRIPHVQVRVGKEHVLAVPQPFLDQAIRELDDYFDENEDWPPAREKVVTLSDGKYAALLYGLTITLFFLLQTERHFQLPLLEKGRADAGAILAGEWWRTITALTLHADFLHLLSNLFYGAFFIAFTCHLVGTGLGLLSVLASGIVGTLMNAAVQDPSHLSIGASTAVFGAVGVYAAFLWADRRRRKFGSLYIWAPILVGLSLLGTYGIPDTYSEEGANVDVVAHATGFVAGMIAGALLGRLGSERLDQPQLQQASGITAAVLVLVGWLAAFS